MWRNEIVPTGTIQCEFFRKQLNFEPSNSIYCLFLHMFDSVQEYEKYTSKHLNGLLNKEHQKRLYYNHRKRNKRWPNYVQMGDKFKEKQKWSVLVWSEATTSLQNSFSSPCQASVWKMSSILPQDISSFINIAYNIYLIRQSHWLQERPAYCRYRKKNIDRQDI